MPRTRNPYLAEFREQIIALARAGRSVEELAREFEPHQGGKCSGSPEATCAPSRPLIGRQKRGQRRSADFLGKAGLR
jgi:hypothetical protein